MVFDEVAKKMVGAFEKRCEELYGPSSLKPKRKRTFRTRTPNAVGTSSKLLVDYSVFFA